LRDHGLRLAAHQMREVRMQIDAGVSVLIALRATTENATAVAVARQADAVVLCIRMGETRLKSAERTLAEVGRDHVLGTIVVRAHDRTAHDPKKGGAQP
jgi:methylmalonyl-CoA mutase cobalamin-binding subunit